MIRKLKHQIRYSFSFFRKQTPYFDGNVEHVVWGKGEKIADKNKVPAIIWLYWQDEKVSSTTAQLCIDHIKQLHPDYTIHLLNRISVLDYLPDFPSQLLHKDANYASDLIRLMLLEKHGGIYLDVTVLLSKRLDWATILQQKDCAEAVLYYTDENTLEEEFPMVESWFIVAIPQSEFISAWRAEYQNSIMSTDPAKYYEDNIMLPLSKFPLQIPYYLVYMAGQIVMRKSQHYRLTLLRAEDDAFLYSLRISRKWKSMTMADILLLNKKPDHLPNTVKIIRYARKRLDFCIMYGFYKEESWLGSMVDDKELF